MVTRQEFLSGLLEPLPAAMAPLAVADIPGAVARGAVSGQPLHEAFSSAVADPLSFEGRTYGEDITGDPYSGMLVELLTDPMALVGAGAAGLGGLGMALARYSRGAATGMGEDVLEKLARGTAAERLLAAQVAADETVSRGLIDAAGEIVESPEVHEMHSRLIEALNDMAVRDPGKQYTAKDLYEAFTPEPKRQPRMAGEAGKPEKQATTGIFKPPGAGAEWTTAAREGKAQFAKSKFLQELLGETKDEPFGYANIEMKEYMLPFLKAFTSNLSEGESVPITKILHEYSVAGSPQTLETQLYKGTSAEDMFKEITHKADLWTEEKMDEHGLGFKEDYHDIEEWNVAKEELREELADEAASWTAQEWGRELRRMAQLDGVDPAYLWKHVRNKGWKQEEIGLFAGIVPPRGTPLEAAEILEDVLFSPEVRRRLSRPVDEGGLGPDYLEKLIIEPSVDDSPHSPDFDWMELHELADRVGGALSDDLGGLSVSADTFIGRVAGREVDETMTLFDWVQSLNMHLNAGYTVAGPGLPGSRLYKTRPGRLTFHGAPMDEYGELMGMELSARRYADAAPPADAAWPDFVNERDQSIPMSEGTEGGLGPVSYAHVFPAGDVRGGPFPEAFGLQERIELRKAQEYGAGEGVIEQWHDKWVQGTPEGYSNVQHQRTGLSRIPGPGMNVEGEHVPSIAVNLGETQGGESIKIREHGKPDVTRIHRIVDEVNEFSQGLANDMVPSENGEYPLIQAIGEAMGNTDPQVARGSDIDLVELRAAIFDHDPEILTDPVKAAKFYVHFLTQNRFKPGPYGESSVIRQNDFERSLNVLLGELVDGGHPVRGGFHPSDLAMRERVGDVMRVTLDAYHNLSPTKVVRYAPQMVAPGARSVEEAKGMYRAELKKSGFHKGPAEDILIDNAVEGREYIIAPKGSAEAIAEKRSILSTLWRAATNPHVEGVMVPYGETIGPITGVDIKPTRKYKKGKPAGYSPGAGSRLYGEHPSYTTADPESSVGTADRITPFPEGHRGRIQKYIEGITGEKFSSLGDRPGVDAHEFSYMRLRDRDGNWISDKVAKLMNYLREKGVPLIPGISPFLVLDAMERQRRR